MERTSFWKKTVAHMLIVAMLFTIVNIPALGYAEAAGAESNYTLYAYSGYDEENDQSLYEEVTDGQHVMVEDWYQAAWDGDDAVWQDYKIVPKDGSFPQWTNPEDGTVPEDAEPWYQVNVACESTEEGAILYEEENNWGEIEYVYDENDEVTGEYFMITLTGLGMGTADVTAVYQYGYEYYDEELGDWAQETVGSVTIADFSATINGVEPVYGILTWNDAEDTWTEVPEGTLTMNLAQMDEDYYYDGLGEYVFFKDTAHKNFGFWEGVTWESDDTSVVEPVYYEDEAERCFLKVNGTGECTVTATYTDDEGGEHAATLNVVVCDYAIKYGSSLNYYDEYSWYNVSPTDGLYTDTEDLVFVKALTSENEELDVTFDVVEGEDIVRIGRNGRVYPLSEGTATVNCEITVGEDSTQIVPITIKVVDPYHVGKLKYILEDGEAKVYGVKYGWNGVIPESISIKKTEYDVTGILDSALFSWDIYDELEVEIPASVTDLRQESLSGADYVTAFSVAEENPAFCSVNGVVFTEDKSELVAYPMARTSSSYTIPEGTTNIWPYALDGCEATKIYLPASLQLDCFVDDDAEDPFWYMWNDFTLFVEPEHTDAIKYLTDAEHSWQPILGKVTNLKAVSRSTSALKLSWTQSDKSGTSGYRVYRYKSGAWTLVKTLSGTATTTYTVTGLSPGTAYQFKVVPYMKYTMYDESYIKNATAYQSASHTNVTTPSKAALKSVTTGSSHYVKATWKKQNASGYEVRFATNYKFTTGVKSYYTTSTTKTLKGLKKGKYYYVKVRAYKKDANGKKVFGAWSTYKKIKCK